MDYLKLIFEELTKLRNELSSITEGSRILPRYVTRKDIWEELGISRAQLDKQPWLMPYFGVSQYPGKPYKWDWKVWKKWNFCSEAERRKAWTYGTEEDFIRRFEMMSDPI